MPRNGPLGASGPPGQSQGQGQGQGQDFTISMLEAVVPGFGIVMRLLKEFFGLDMSTFVPTIALLAGLLGASRYFWRAVSSLWSQYFMSSITISSTDRLHEQVMSYMSAKIVKDSNRSLMAKAGKQGGETNLDYIRSQNQNDLDAAIPPTYSPAPGKHRFWYKGNLFALNIYYRNGNNNNNNNNRFGNTQNESEELLTLSCHGRSTKPIKHLLLECKRAFAHEKREMTTVRSPDPRGMMWRRTTTRLSRPLDSVYLDPATKQEAIQDMLDFLHPSASKFYARRGIPYRRGYLFHGEPGTGKTSLSLALAGAYGLELHVLSLSDPEMSDQKLSYLFASLPPRCIVLLEDIDAVGLYRPQALADAAPESEKPKPVGGEARGLGIGGGPLALGTNESLLDRPRGLRRGGPSTGEAKGVTLSGALNAIDGVASQEGRILIMTTNDPEALDKALVRPGRVDLQVYFGHVSRAHAREIFERMYTPDEDDTTALFAVDEKVGGGMGVGEMAEVFAGALPEGRLTPAELQGYLLARRNKPGKALGDLEGWVGEVLAAKAQERNILRK